MRALRLVVFVLPLLTVVAVDPPVAHAIRAPARARVVRAHKPKPPRFRALRGLIKPGNLRASLMGLSDGIASVFGLVAATTAMASDHGPITSRSVLLAGLAAMVSGAASMASGEYSSVSYDNEQLIASRKGSDPPLELNSPTGAAASSFTSFLAGAVVPMTPIMLGMTGTPAVVVSGVLSVGTLALAGGKLARMSGNSSWRSTLRLAVAATFGAAISWGAGALLGQFGVALPPS